MANWADTPFTLIKTPQLDKDVSSPVVSIATDMALIHNVFFRALNSIYLQAPYVKQPTDTRDFLTYCECWYEALEHHHTGEERTLFPAIAKLSGEPHIMDGNVDGHRAFHNGLEAFAKYVRETTPEEFDSKVLRGIIDGFKAPFESHMNDEIQTILALEKYDGEKLRKASDALAEDIKATADKSRLFPIVLGGRDITFEGGLHNNWPPLPFFVPYLVHYVFERKYKGAWRFSPSDSFGKPRKLAFLP